MATTHGAMVTVSRFNLPHEAQLKRMRLESAGIPVELLDQNVVSLNWFYAQAAGGIRLVVPAERAAEAARLLAERDDAPGETACGRCGSPRTVRERDNRFPLLSFYLLGFPLFPPRVRLRCLECGKRASPA